jgi:hypothetical protein
VRRLESAYSIITWSDDGTRVVKTFPAHRPPPQIFDRSRFDYERRVNALLLRHPPGVSFAPLLGADRRNRTLTFAAVDGEPIGPKFPTELDDATVDELVGLAWAVPGRVSSCRWLRKLGIVERLNSAVAIGAVSPGDAERIRSIARAHRPVLRLCHGDLTARNVLRSGRAGLVLIDWEWAGLYPVGYDAAFLWYSLVDVAGARERVAGSVAASARPWFWISALFIQLLHLEIYLGRTELAGFLPRQLATRDELVDRVLTLAAP